MFIELDPARIVDTVRCRPKNEDEMICKLEGISDLTDQETEFYRAVVENDFDKCQTSDEGSDEVRRKLRCYRE